MALFTTADRDAIKVALVQLAVNGIATVSIGTTSVTTKDIDQLTKLLEMVNADLAADHASSGLRFTQLIPGGCG